MPVLHLLAGPNGAGKTTFCEHVLGPATRLPFINADELAKAHWPGAEERHGHCRLGSRVAAAISRADQTMVYEQHARRAAVQACCPVRVGEALSATDWPAWSPLKLAS